MSDEAIPAATLIVIREQPGRSPELLMVERSAKMAFAAGALVFPGGRIDASDDLAANEFRTSPAKVAAIRETLEETAVPVGISPAASPDLSAELQQKLLAGELFGSALRLAGLEITPDVLTPFARWVPKFHAVRRFDTLFFIAKCPEGDWQPLIVAGECAAANWLSATQVLERERSGSARLIFPTRRTLERLAQHESFDAIEDDARMHPIEPISPWVEEHGGEKLITIPSHLGFPVTQERLDGLWRG